MSITAEVADAAIVSMLPDIHAVPLTADVAIDPSEYAQVMRGVFDGNSDTPVSAFNSSI